MSEFERVSVIGAGVIGSSWTALFLAAGLQVEVFDPAPDGERAVREYVERAWPTLEALGMTQNGDPGRVRFHRSASGAVENAQFVQESVPERLSLKHEVFAEIEPHLSPEVVVASSASGLMVSEMQQGWRDPSRFLLGHPFNPPHLIPLVELLANERTAAGVLEAAEAFYEQVGKVTIRIKREAPGHVANRLQAALWREAIHLVTSGVASVEDVDKAIWAGPGQRWAAMGPHMLFHLGAGPGGLQEFCTRYGPSFQRWWEDLGEVALTPEVAELLADGVRDEAGGQDVQTLSAHRDALIVNMLRGTLPLRNAERQQTGTVEHRLP
jgi:carnitine 3-dehydrogenase